MLNFAPIKVQSILMRFNLTFTYKLSRYNIIICGYMRISKKIYRYKLFKNIDLKRRDKLSLDFTVKNVLLVVGFSKVRINK